MELRPTVARMVSKREQGSRFKRNALDSQLSVFGARCQWEADGPLGGLQRGPTDIPEPTELIDPN